MRYVGIDPSTKTGLVILGDKGNVLLEKEITSKVENDPHRFMDLSDQIIKLINQTCKSEDVKIAIEGFSFGSKGKGVSTTYGIGWAIRILLVECLLEYFEIPPTSVKKFATGKGNVNKDNMVLPIFKHWGFENPSDNVRDAFVLAQMAKAMNDTSNLTGYQIEALKKVTE